MTISDLERAREDYAQRVGDAAGLTSPALRRALATVPREHFLGPGPWKIVRSGALNTYQETPDDDPRHLYDDVLVAIDADRRLNNGHPASLVSWLSRLPLVPGARFLHIGCGVGYYTAIAALAVGPSGRVVGVEVDSTLAESARRNLSAYSHVQVINADGSEERGEMFDAIFVNAGATEVRSQWTDSLRPGGTLLLPLTVSAPALQAGVGFLLEVVKRGIEFSARFVSPVGIYHCTGARTEAGSERLRRAYQSGHERGHQSVRRLRTDRHEQQASCWLHESSFCLATDATEEDEA